MQKSQLNESIRDKKPFDFAIAMRKLRGAVKDDPKAAMFELADEGFDSLFEQLIACMISVRTLEHVTLATARRLFGVARTPEKMASLSVTDIDDLIRNCTFHDVKAENIRTIAQTVMQKYGGLMPTEPELVMGFVGVGPKCTNLAVGISSGHPIGIPVDVHVHRVVNRWGILETRSPEQTMEQLQEVLPRRYWLEINKLLVPFGKHICRAARPACPTCPLLPMCQQVGVKQTGTPEE